MDITNGIQPSASDPSAPGSVLGATVADSYASAAQQPTTSVVQGANGPQQVNTSSPDFNQDKSVPKYDPQAANTTAAANASQPGSRLKSILSAVASTVDTGLAGIPNKGRPGFISGLGGGARAEQEAQAAQQEIKFKTFDDSVRAANLHAQDLQKQAATADQQKAQQAAEDFQKEELGNNGGTLDTHPNDGTAVLQTLQGQTAANGSASITPGTHISANGKDILVPANTPETLSAQIKNYNALAGMLPGMPGKITPIDPASVKGPQDVAAARAAVGKNLDIMQHLTQGYNVDGSPLNHKQLNDLIPAYQSQIDALTKSGTATPYQIGTLKNTLAILQANEQHHTDKEQEVSDQATSNAVDKATQLGDVSTANKKTLQDNAAANKAANAKPGKADTAFYVGTDAAGNQIAGTSDQLTQAGAQGVTKLDSDTAKKVTQAREMISPDGLFSAVAKDVADLQTKGKLGVAASRWNEFMGGTVGTDPDFAPLRTDMGLLATKLMQVHVGARGSAEMLHHFANLADYKISDAPTLTSALKAEYRYIHGAAMLPKAQAQGGQ